MTVASPPRLSDFTNTLDVHTKSLDFVRFLACLHEEKGSPNIAAQTFALRWPRATHRELVTKAIADWTTKAATTPGAVSDAIWAGPLAPLEPLASAFLAYSRP